MYVCVCIYIRTCTYLNSGRKEGRKEGRTEGRTEGRKRERKEGRKREQGEDSLVFPSVRSFQVES